MKGWGGKRGKEGGGRKVGRIREEKGGGEREITLMGSMVGMLPQWLGKMTDTRSETEVGLSM